MAERGFFTGFVLPLTGALAVAAATRPAHREPASGEDTAADRTYGRAMQKSGRPRKHQGGDAAEPDRGRQADKPHQIPAQGWRDILLRVKDGISNDHVSVIAAAIGFYAMLALFPALAAAVSIYGLVAEPQDVERQLSMAVGLIPEEAQSIITDQLHAIASQPRQTLGVSALVALAFALWSASSAMQTLMTGLNMVYGEQEKRSFARFYATALLLTLGGIVGAIIALSLIAALPVFLNFIGLPQALATTLSLLRWPLLAITVMLGLAALYRYGPSREKPRWQWVSWGAVAATVLWLLGSVLFSWYVSSFGSYSVTYGALGAVIILMMWFYITGYAVLLGGELNAEMERQTARDTTERRGAPLGTRDAYAADSVGASP
jgi:membrane protein